MSRIKDRNTAPELRVRKLVYSLGYRYRIHYNLLPGKPDLAFIGLRKVIFVHGCFWYQHKNCKTSHIPKTNVEYWVAKLDRNCQRDLIHEQSLINAGWMILVIWECEQNLLSCLNLKLYNFLRKRISRVKPSVNRKI